MSTATETVEIAGRSVPMTGVGLRIVLVDNYDSFTYNLYQYLLMLGAEVEVVRNDEVSAAEIAERRPDGIVLSPGPSSPEHAGITPDVIRLLGPTTPMLGVCLGHQAMGMVYGGDVIRAEPVHGKRSPVEHTGVGVFAGLPSPLEAGRYHSLAIKRETMPDVLEVTAWSPDGLVMGVRHREHPVEGIQFHPESILTDDGAMMLSTWLASVVSREPSPAA
jgi:anthranilate synthase/aminodeoxychorismate synthase-like glutamine amidotransferase